MVASCMIFLASFGNAEMPIEENWATIQHTKECTEVIPFTMIEYVPFYVEFYEEKHLYKALRIGWCESRGKESAYREEDDDSGIMQFIPNTWNWVAEKFNIPLWDVNVLTYDTTEPYPIVDKAYGSSCVPQSYYELCQQHVKVNQLLLLRREYF